MKKLFVVFVSVFCVLNLLATDEKQEMKEYIEADLNPQQDRYTKDNRLFIRTAGHVFPLFHIEGEKDTAYSIFTIFQ